jgi:dihydroneopterin aldolase
MLQQASIELRDLKLATKIGTYGPDDVIPDHHLLDLTLWIDSKLVLIPQDGMEFVFDYDPLIEEIDRIAADGHYETQERLMTLIIKACAQYQAIQTLEIGLRKGPVRRGTGSLGVKIAIDRSTLISMR